MKRITVLALSLASIATIIATAPTAITNWNEASEMYKSENACINELVQASVERINIASGNGTCWYEVNGYYNN